ncbi:hypothetical protein [Paenibacillus oceani]|uniref:Uncharacterized protein n=1 Tax=Paenibacillus oceani TaxID=2772510 RepID=A0A927H224_9BACL|nr:hypothetical protein [Paenibacillus oceani]MBD2865801.1 hypothetical protein [Paenibacillus oceani]
MEVMRFLLFSSLEWLALFILTFAMFKFPYRGFWGQIILCSVLLSFLSYVLFDVLHLRPLAPIIQLPLVIICTWQVFRVHLFYAALMTTYGYNGYAFIQILFIVVMKGAGLTFQELISTPYFSILQNATIVVTLLIGWFVHKRRLGFSFIPDFELVRVKFRGINLWLLVLIILGNIQFATYSFLATKSTEAFLVSTIVLMLLLYFARKKEFSYD